MVGALGRVCLPAPLLTPAISNKFAVDRGGDVSMGSSRNILEVPTALEAVEVLAMVSVGEAIAT